MIGGPTRPRLHAHSSAPPARRSPALVTTATSTRSPAGPSTPHVVADPGHPNRPTVSGSCASLTVHPGDQDQPVATLTHTPRRPPWCSGTRRWPRRARSRAAVRAQLALLPVAH